MTDDSILKEPTRNEEDLDSISCGSDSTSKVKIYYNSRKDSEEVIKSRILMAVNLAAEMRDKMVAAGLYAPKSK